MFVRTALRVRLFRLSRRAPPLASPTLGAARCLAPLDNVEAAA
jgi:hypothetical protein